MLIIYSFFKRLGIEPISFRIGIYVILPKMNYFLVKNRNTRFRSGRHSIRDLKIKSNNLLYQIFISSIYTIFLHDRFVSLIENKTGLRPVSRLRARTGCYTVRLGQVRLGF